MTIRLRPEHERLIAQALATGAYDNPDDVIARALEMLHSDDEWLREHGREVSDKIDRALEQFERGEFFTDQESVADMEKRKAVWLNARKG